MSNGMVLTETGRNLLALALTGKELHFTRGAVGDGWIPSGRTPGEMTGLISEKKTLPIQSIRVSATGTCECVFQITNQGMAQGFWLREYGLYARHPDTGAEVLYSYCNKEGHAGYLEGADGIDLISFALTLTTVIDRAENITAEISTSNSYVTDTKLEARIEDMYANSADIKGVWVYGKDTEGRFSPVKWETFRAAILGDLGTRIAALERG